jgi:hypothetical protein
MFDLRPLCTKADVRRQPKFTRPERLLGWKSKEPFQSLQSTSKDRGQNVSATQKAQG